MRTLDIPQIRAILGDAMVSKNIQRRLNVSIVNSIDLDMWASYELLNIPTKDRVAGVMLIELGDDMYATAYEISSIVDKSTGRAKPIICDFCKTWQPGGRAGVVTFRPYRRSLNSISLLCCLDLGCSMHVRDMSQSSATSRSQLHEDVSCEYRVGRLQHELSTIIERLGLSPLTNHIQRIK